MQALAGELLLIAVQECLDRCGGGLGLTNVEDQSSHCKPYTRPTILAWLLTLLQDCTSKLKLHLFIGHHKSGSTSIQHHLAVNSQPLLKRGYLYPFADLISILCSRCGFPSGSMPDGMRSELQKRIQDFCNHKDFLEPHNGLAFIMLREVLGCEVPAWHKGLPSSSDEIFSLIHEQTAESNAHTLLIASEVLANFSAAGKGLVSHLMQGLPAAEIFVHAILRRPDDYLHSWYCQELCFGYPRMGSLPQRLRNRYLSSIHVDYELMLKDWVHIHDGSHVNLADYRDVRLGNGSVAWFLKAVGLDEPDQNNAHESSWANPSLHPAYVNLVRHSNTVLDRKQAIGLTRELKTLGPTDGLPPPGQVELLGRISRQLLFERFAPINCYLGSLVHRPLFFPDLNEMITERPLALSDVEADAAIIAQKCLGDRLSPDQRELLDDWVRGTGITRLR